MRMAGRYSFKSGEEEITHRYPDLLTEVNAAIKAVDAVQHKNKSSKERTMKDRILFSPSSLNKAFKTEFAKMGWRTVKIDCTYPTTYYLEDYQIRSQNRGVSDIDIPVLILGIDE